MATLDPKRVSRFLSVMLRHEPHKFGITLDAEGFTDADRVFSVVCSRFGLTPEEITAVLQSPGGQQRFELHAGRIRAMYGHSTVEVTYPPAVPPEILYHGTTAEAWNAIQHEGLTAQKRQYVHLSVDTERAQNVATRHGRAIILRIRALAAHEGGIIFYHPEPRHYLVKALPPHFISSSTMSH